MTNKKMIVVDLDGTLLNKKSHCTEKTIKYLKKLKSMGFIIVIATGRVLYDAMKVTNGAEFADYIIGSCGGVVYDRNNYKLIDKNCINKEYIRRVFNIFNDDFNNICVCDLFNYSRYNYQGKMGVIFDREIKDVDKFLNNNDDIVNLIIKFNDDKIVDKYADILHDDGIELVVMKDSFRDKRWIEVLAKDVSKYNAIKIIMNIENIDNDDVISFGDSMNDIDMVKLSGVGVAMENAIDEIKNVSKYITISHDDDGVIYFLKKYMKEMI